MVLDPELLGHKDGPIHYQGVIVEMLDFDHRDIYHPIHRMIGLTRPTKPRYQVWSLDNVLRSAHVVPVSRANTRDGTQRFVVNYALDWNSWMTLAPDNFIEINARAAQQAFAQKFATKEWGNRPNFRIPKYQYPPDWVTDADQLLPSQINQVFRLVPVPSTHQFPAHPEPISSHKRNLNASYGDDSSEGECGWKSIFRLLTHVRRRYFVVRN